MTSVPSLNGDLFHHFSSVLHHEKKCLAFFFHLMVLTSCHEVCLYWVKLYRDLPSSCHEVFLEIVDKC